MNLVDDILDMSKFNANTFQLNINQFRLGDLLKDIDYIFGFQCAEKHIDFKIDCSTADTESIFRSDSKRIKQVLINLISNSFKFTERGKIKVKVGKYERKKECYLKFVVSDTGVGISKQDIPKLFKMFGMLSKHRNKMNQSGTGLGLAISKKIVESLRGKIKVSSCENEWTKFTFTIKIEKDEKVRIEESKYEHFENEMQYLSREESKLKQSNEELQFQHHESQNNEDQVMSLKIDFQKDFQEELQSISSEELTFRRKMLKSDYDRRKNLNCLK